MNKRNSLIALIALAAFVAGGWLWQRRITSNATTQANAVTPSPTVTEKSSATVIAAPGRVEPISEEIKINAEISGRLRAVLVEEGQSVQRGQTVALLEDSDYRARLVSAEAVLQQKEAELRRVANGARGQERREAAAAITEAEAVVANAQSEYDRRQGLYRTGDIAREEVERAERQLNVAQARAAAVKERHAFVDAPAREEDLARAEAEIALAKARIAEARAMLDKTVIRAPLNGVVLRKHLKTGESALAATMGNPQPIVTLADTSRLRVRVDVDEADIGKLAVGQTAYVRADAYGAKRFSGRVVRIGEILGKKNVRTDEPTEKVDTKILETLVELEAGSELKPGLRVDAFIETASPER